MWGFGNAIVFYATTAQMNVTNNWIHDAVNASPLGYHTDGPGYINGGAGPSNVLIQGNTIASLGNTQGIALQGATSGYSNIQVTGNYLSGFGYTAELANGSTSLTNSAFTNNVYGTDIEPVWGPLYGLNAGSNTTWACNKIAIASGTSWTDGGGWTPTSAINGEYWIPTSAIASTTDWNGNTSCAPQAPTGLAAAIE